MEYVSNHNLRISKLTLGTAQLRSSYGIANVIGKPEYQQAATILRVALESGINSFDTAPAYGDSEKVIGDTLSAYPPAVIITKLPPVSIAEIDGADSIYLQIKKCIFRSRKYLRLKKIPIYLLHRSSDMQNFNGLVIESCLKMKRKGLIGLLGVSTYSPQDVETVLNIGGIDAVQVPLNLFDHRLIQSGLLNKLKEKQIIVFARSLFLQGLFFLDINKLPPNLNMAYAPLKKLSQFLSDYKLNIFELAIAFVRDLPGVTSLVIGAETPKQVLNNIRLMNSASLAPDIRNQILSLFSDLPLELINPSLWKL